MTNVDERLEAKIKANASSGLINTGDPYEMVLKIRPYMAAERSCSIKGS